MASNELSVDRLRYERCQYRLRPPGWTYPPAIHKNLWEMYICWQGVFHVGFQHTGVDIERHQAVLIPPSTPHEAAVTAPVECLVMILLFRTRWARLREIGARQLILSDRAMARLRELVNMQNPHDLADVRHRSQLALFLTELIEPQDTTELPTLTDMIPGAQHPLVERVIAHLAGDLRQGLQMNELCELTGYSASRLRHLFRQHCGLSIQECMMRLRLEEAQRLLLTSQFKIGAIANLVGFKQVAKFNHFFRARMGMTPGQFMASRIRFGGKWGSPADADEVKLSSLYDV